MNIAPHSSTSFEPNFDLAGYHERTWPAQTFTSWKPGYHETSKPHRQLLFHRLRGEPVGRGAVDPATHSTIPSKGTTTAALQQRRCQHCAPWQTSALARVALPLMPMPIARFEPSLVSSMLPPPLLLPSGWPSARPSANVSSAFVASWEAKYGSGPGQSQASPRRSPQTAVTPHNSSPPLQRRVSRDGFVNPDHWTVDSATEMPAAKTYVAKKKQVRREKMGRKYDHLRSAGAVIVRHQSKETSSPWRDYIQASKWAPIAGERSEKIDPEQLEALMPGFNETKTVGTADTTVNKRRSRRGALYEHIWRLLLNHPLVPALLRFSVLVLSLASLGLAGNLWKLYGVSFETAAVLKSQWLVAIAVDCLLSPYVVYMTWDEYSSPQLGLRSPMRKAALTLLDLVFIIFKAASATLAFDSLSLQGAPYGEMAKMKALASFLLLGLIGWIMNFTVNVFRLVQRLDRDSSPRLRISQV